MTELETNTDQESLHEQTLVNIETYVDSLLDSSNTVQVDHDDALKALGINDSESLNRHNTSYDAILNNYTEHVSKTLASKRKMKWLFFVVAILTMVSTVIFVIVCAIIITCNIQNEKFSAQDYIVPAISALASFLTTFVVIPKIIAEYLFNSNEDAVMKDIVANIQEYDKFIRNNLPNSFLNNDK